MYTYNAAIGTTRTQKNRRPKEEKSTFASSPDSLSSWLPFHPVIPRIVAASTVYHPIPPNFFCCNHCPCSSSAPCWLLPPDFRTRFLVFLYPRAKQLRGRFRFIGGREGWWCYVVRFL
ncbi:hypothetical protein EJ110_NYTH13270 [Nymphaea thermarum]|nr:hypothetical protein EJ110_NYTH13270 [Nymphaea thermarum]